MTDVWLRDRRKAARGWVRGNDGGKKDRGAGRRKRGRNERAVGGRKRINERSSRALPE